MFQIVLNVCILPKFWAVLSSSQKQSQEKQVYTKNNCHSSVREHTMLTTHPGGRSPLETSDRPLELPGCYQLFAEG